MKTRNPARNAVKPRSLKRRLSQLARELKVVEDTLAANPGANRGALMSQLFRIRKEIQEVQDILAVDNLLRRRTNHEHQENQD